jgi:hypothetical protein
MFKTTCTENHQQRKYFFLRNSNKKKTDSSRKIKCNNQSCKSIVNKVQISVCYIFSTMDLV